MEARRTGKNKYKTPRRGQGTCLAPWELAQKRFGMWVGRFAPKMPPTGACSPVTPCGAELKSIWLVEVDGGGGKHGTGQFGPCMSFTGTE